MQPYVPPCGNTISMQILFLYNNAISAVQMKGSKREWFRTILVKRIMSDAPEEYDGKVSIGGRTITNLRFADDIDAFAEGE